MVRVLLPAALVAVSMAAELQRALIIAHKVITAPDTKDQLVLGKPFTVSYSVLNVGQTDAVNVTLGDDWPADTFEAVQGAAQAAWPLLPPGANETLTIVLSPKVAGELSAKGAAISYSYALGEEESGEEGSGEEGSGEDLISVSSYSTAPGYMRILTPEAYAKYAVNTTMAYSFTVAAAIALIVLAGQNWFNVSKKV